MEEIGEESVDWHALLDGLPRFDCLPNLDFPPLYDVEDFFQIPGFFTLVTEPEEEVVCETYNWVRVEMDHFQKKAIFKDFKELCSRLENFPPLASYMD